MVRVVSVNEGQLAPTQSIKSPHSLTDLTALATFRLSASPIQGTTVHSESSNPSISSTHHKQGEAVP